MGFLDRAKEAAQRAKSGARVAREQGQHRLEELQARRQAEVLLREVGLAAYEEHRGEGGHEAVVRAVARLDEHVRAHNIDLATSGLRGYLRTAAGTDEPARTTREAGAHTASSAAQTPGEEPRDSAGTTGDESGDDTAADDDARTPHPSGPAGEEGPAKKAAAKKMAAKKTAAKKTTAAKKAVKKATAKKTTHHHDQTTHHYDQP